MKRRLGVSLMALGAWLLAIAVITPVTPATAARGDYSFTDRFSSGRYNGNNGTNEYTGPWWESLDWGGSGKGAVTVIIDDGDCPQSSCARIAGETRFSGTGLARTADIEGAATATLKFKYRLAVDERSSGRLEVAVFDGWNWTTLESFDLRNEDDDAVHIKSYNVIDHASRFFAVGFFAYGDWFGAAYIDDVKVSGLWEDSTTTTSEPSTTSSTTTVPPTTTTSSAPTTTTATVTTTAPPGTTTTSVAPPTTTTRPPSVTTRPPPTPTAPPATVPATTTTTSPTTRPPSTEAPLTNDARYRDKGAFALFVFDDELTTATGALVTMPGEVELPKPGPVTQIMASLTVTAVTIRSHLLSAIALGLLIAAVALIGLGRREEPV